MHTSGYRFTSAAFVVEPGEDAATNPCVYGRQLARWLRERFVALGYPVEEPIPEDWGWCVMCRREPFLLWIGCANLPDDDDLPAADGERGGGDALHWHAFAAAEVPLMRRLFTRTDAAPALARLSAELGDVLAAGPSVRLLGRLV